MCNMYYCLHVLYRSMFQYIYVVLLWAARCVLLVAPFIWRKYALDLKSAKLCLNSTVTMWWEWQGRQGGTPLCFSHPSALQTMPRRGSLVTCTQLS